MKNLNAFLNRNPNNSDRFIIKSENDLYHINSMISHVKPEI